MKTKMKKIDYKKEFKHLYSPSAKNPEIVNIPKANYLMIEGKGDPNTSRDFQEAVEALYGLSYTIKFMMKQDKKDPFDYTVLPLEGLWYAHDYNCFRENRREQWQWTLMIQQPDRITEHLVKEAKIKLKEKKDPAALEKIYFKSWTEGLSAQIMHIGPYSEEHPTIEKLHAFIKENGYTFNGEHHELYIGDPRKGDPKKLRTILRHPVKKR